jgi:hypothetical protein
MPQQNTARSTVSQPDPRAYLAKHLKNELWYLLCAATEWHVQDMIPDPGVGADYVQVYAMDSAALHARSLFEFFTQSSRSNHLGLNLYGLQPIPSERYGDRNSDPANGCWSSPLHAFLMHLQDRSFTQQLKSSDGTSMKDLNKMPVDFANEAARLWRIFVARLTNQSDPLAPLAQSVLDDAIGESAKVVANDRNARHGITPIAW